MRDLQLLTYLQEVPYGGVTFMQNGDYYGNHADHERQYREKACTLRGMRMLMIDMKQMQ